MDKVDDILVQKDNENEANYLCCDLKSFYASVECAERNLDPFTTNLVVADPDRSKGTLCLAITPAMKALGVKNRCRIYEIPLNIDYIVAPPRMQLYIDYSARIYEIYLKYFSKDDIHVYSIDESFVDCTPYKELYGMTAKEIGIRLINDIYETTGITATLGVGSNLYLAKVALDITAKHAKDHIGILTEETFQQKLWHHKEMTDFWRIGPGIEKRLKSFGITDMADITQMNEDQLYKMFGVDAELIIDHAWGIETTTMQDIKQYKPKDSSLSSTQVLLRDYEYEEAKLIVKEMLELLCLDLVDKNLITDSVSLYVGYSHSTEFPVQGSKGSISLMTPTSSPISIRPQLVELYERIVYPNVPIRHIGISFNRLIDETIQQYDLFTDPEQLEKERDVQKAMIEIKSRFGKNAVLKGMNLLDAGTTRERNVQIGGHKA